MIRLYWTMATVVAAILAFANFAIAHSSAPSATIDAGVVVGLTTSVPSSPVAVNQFLGVPFAAPPKRFARAHKPQPWSRPLETKQKGPSCIQQFFCELSYWYWTRNVQDLMHL
jgi:carboxylesterase type B